MSGVVESMDGCESLCSTVLTNIQVGWLGGWGRRALGSLLVLSIQLPQFRGNMGTLQEGTWFWFARAQERMGIGLLWMRKRDQLYPSLSILLISLFSFTYFICETLYGGRNMPYVCREVWNCTCPRSCTYNHYNCQRGKHWESCRTVTTTATEAPKATVATATTTTYPCCPSHGGKEAFWSCQRSSFLQGPSVSLLSLLGNM